MVLPSHLPHLYAKREPLLMSMSDCLTVWLVGYFSLSLHTQSKREAEELRDTESRKWRGKKSVFVAISSSLCSSVTLLDNLAPSHFHTSQSACTMSLYLLALSLSLALSQLLSLPPVSTNIHVLKPDPTRTHTLLLSVLLVSVCEVLFALTMSGFVDGYRSLRRRAR